QCPARGRKPSLAPYALQYLAQDEIREGQPPARHLSIQPLRLGSRGAPQIINPDRCIDDDHEAWRTRPARILARSPSHSPLPRKRRLPDWPFPLLGCGGPASTPPRWVEALRPRWPSP